MAAALPMPLQDAIATPRNKSLDPKAPDANEGMLTYPWTQYFQQQGSLVAGGGTRIGSAALTTQGASISATDLTGGTGSAGLYVLQYYARITRAASTSSSLTVTVSYTDHSVVQSTAGAAITGNTTTSKQTDIYLLYSDSTSPITYATTYASVGGTTMQYELYVTLTEVPS